MGYRKNGMTLNRRWACIAHEFIQTGPFNSIKLKPFQLVLDQALISLCDFYFLAFYCRNPYLNNAPATAVPKCRCNFL